MDRILGAVVAFILVFDVQPAAAREEPAAKEREALVAQLLDAFNRQDPEAMARLVTPDLQWLNISDSRTIAEANSREDLVKGMTAYFQSCPSCRSRHAGLLSTRDRVAVIEVAEWMKSGVKHSQRSICVYEFSGGLIRRVYYFPSERDR